MNEAKEKAEGDEKLLKTIQELLQELPKDSPSAKPSEDKSKPAGKALSPEEQEKAELAKLSNIQWLIYPFKKMICHLLGYICRRKQKKKSD